MCSTTRSGSDRVHPKARTARRARNQRSHPGPVRARSVSRAHIYGPATRWPFSPTDPHDSQEVMRLTDPIAGVPVPLPATDRLLGGLSPEQAASADRHTVRSSSRLRRCGSSTSRETHWGLSENPAPKGGSCCSRMWVSSVAELWSGIGLLTRTGGGMYVLAAGLLIHGGIALRVVWSIFVSISEEEAAEIPGRDVQPPARGSL